MKIAAYCRVSTGSKEQLSSLENQKKFFYEYAKSNNHTLVRLYADEGISGTSLKKRVQFQKLMEDAKLGIFEMVVVKDISRFARNTVDFLSSVRTLKGLGINTLFLTANMTSFGESEFLLAIYGAAIELGKEPEDVLRVLSTLKPVSGRFETLHSPEGFSAIVDYAHTPDAIKNVLGTVNDVLRGRGNIITVIGAGGNRDKGKRPIMAVEAVKGSQRVILTSDNPRNEDPQDIINDMLAGLDTEQRKKTIAITDRREAIRTACAFAQKGDVIVVAGKGHENYQEINGVKHHFDDKEIINEIFNN